jgi:hypothetical protein
LLRPKYWALAACAIRSTIDTDTTDVRITDLSPSRDDRPLRQWA